MLVTLVLLIITVICYYKWAHGYWNRKNVPTLKTRFIMGNVQLDKAEAHFISYWKFYNTLKEQGCKHGGFYVFFRPLYIPIDLEYVKLIMQKDFQYFPHRGIESSEKQALTQNLFTMRGDKWKEMRNQMTPIFTVGKLKSLTLLIVKCAEPMREAFANAKGPIDVNEISSNFSVDVIGSCGFGIECNSFKNPNAEFKKHAINVFTHSFLGLAKMSLMYLFPKFTFSIGFNLIRKTACDFYLKTIRSVIEFRENTDYRRNDAMQNFVDLKRTQKVPMTIEHITSQVYMFFVAGHETTSTTIAFALFEIAKHKEIQRKVREEIIAVLELHDGNVTYDSLLEMKYTEQVIEETLRMYPPSPVQVRKVDRDYTIPGTDITLEAGTAVVIPTIAIHNDPEYFEDPHLFNPERFSEANKCKIRPLSYQPFGAGPRVCIAIKFSIIEVKVAIIASLREFEVDLNPKTPPEPEWDYFSLVLKNKHDMLLDFKKIEM